MTTKPLLNPKNIKKICEKCSLTDSFEWANCTVAKGRDLNVMGSRSQ